MSLCLAIPVIAYSQSKGNNRPNSHVSQRQVNSPAKTQELPATKPLTAREIVDRVLPSVVLIVSQDENGQAVGQGSGFFYKPGLVVTNLHVFTRASQAYAKVLNGGITYKVLEVVGIDMRRDLCVIKVADTSTPPLLLNRANKPEVGDEVYVASNPKGLEGSFSKGIVSGIRKDFGLIQIDAAISPGSSGGAVVNTRAEVVGIAVSSLVGGQNLNFAIPVEYLDSLKLNLRVSVIAASAFSRKDRDKDRLKGLVKSVVVTKASFDYDERSGKYFEKAAEMIEKSVYDLDGNKVEVEALFLNKKLIKHIYIYDENGFKTRHIYEFDGTRREYEVTLAESMTEKLNERMFSGTTTTSPQSKSVYDRDGNEIENTFNYNATEFVRRVFTYGRHGFVNEEKFYDNDKLHSVSRYSYETDDYGNWIKRYETLQSAKDPELGFTPSSVTYREIIYFGQ